jgi:hypothetical protein
MAWHDCASKLQVWTLLDMTSSKRRTGPHTLAARPLVQDLARALTAKVGRCGWVFGLLLAGLASQPALAADAAPPLPPAMAEQRSQEASLQTPPVGSAYLPRRANFEQNEPSRDARHVADWVLDSGDNGGMPFVVIDKVDAKVFVFDALGQLRGAAPALLGLAIGDEAVPGIGQRKLSTIRPEERTTSAGRFVAAQDRNLQGKDILWIDYDSAISLHPVVTGTAKERRAERLASPSPLDNRVSYGCINVPVPFYKNVVGPAFSGTDGIVYVLPETRSVREVFGSYDVEERARLRMAGQTVPAPSAGPAGW